MDQNKRKALQEGLEIRRKRVREHLLSRTDAYAGFLSVPHLRDAASLYIVQGGKYLRAQLLLLSCGIVGGREDTALPAAAALEAFHAWTLIHDDIIDQDRRRRGGPTIHEECRRKAVAEWGLEDSEAQHYGRSMGILAGDVLQGWTVSLLCELSRGRQVELALVVALLEDLNLQVRSVLLDGETMDVQFPRLSPDRLDTAAVEEMVYRKTGALYEFAGRAGAMIGLGRNDPEHPQVRALSSFAGRCGISFQLQDDVLGVVGHQGLLGKPTGSDIRLGKRTLVNVHALEHASPAQRERLLRVFGNPLAGDAEIEETKSLLKELGSVAYCRARARAHLVEAVGLLESLPPSGYKDLLCFWAESMVERDY